MALLDKNGAEIRTGMVVEITGAYFKNDNGFYFVEKSPGDPSWCGRDYCLKKISRAGKVSQAKYNICFWPIKVFTNSRLKAAEAEAWNREHAQIEIRAVKNTDELVAHFEALAASLSDGIRWSERNFGEDSEDVKRGRETQAFLAAVAAKVKGGEV